MARSSSRVWGGARQLCPGNSDVDFLGDFDSVVNLDPEISDGALDLGVAEQQLNGSKIAGSPINQGRLRSAQRVRSELQRIEADARDPFADEAGILAGCQAAVRAASTCEQELPASAGYPQVLVDRLPGLFGEFEPYGPAGLLLSYGRPVKRVAVRSYIVDADCDHIATAKLAVDREVEEGEIAGALLQLKPRPN